MGLTSHRDLHWVCPLVDLDVGPKVLLQSLDGLPTLPDDTAHDALVAVNHLGNASSILQGTQDEVQVTGYPKAVNEEVLSLQHLE